jgi:hypothetical protein
VWLAPTRRARASRSGASSTTMMSPAPMIRARRTNMSPSAPAPCTTIVSPPRKPWPPSAECPRASSSTWVTTKGSTSTASSAGIASGTL